RPDTDTLSLHDALPISDEQFGEEVCAWIRVKAGASLSEEEVRAFCRGRIAHYKIPRYIVVVEEYPTTVTGKVQKFKLREMGIARSEEHTSELQSPYDLV